MVVGLHGSHHKNVEIIRANGPVPGDGQHHWVGAGVYAYEICSDPARGQIAAYANATAFAEKKFGKDQGGCVAFTLSDRHLLDLQHPSIFAALRKFHSAIVARAKSIGLRLEPTFDWVRAPSHLSIDALCLCLEALLPHPIEVVRAQFTGAAPLPVEELKNPELCIKRPEAILSVRKVGTANEEHSSCGPAASWSPSSILIKAATDAHTLLSNLDDPDFVDLLVEVAEGANHFWYRKARFQIARSVTLVATASSPLVDEVQLYRTAAQQPNSMSVDKLFQTDQLKNFPGPEMSRRIGELITRSSGLVVIVERPDIDLYSVLLRARQHDLPTLVFAAKDISLPCEILSMRNVTVIDLDADKKQRQRQIHAGIRGFTAADWKTHSLQPRMRLMLAARECNRDTNKSKIDHIGNVRKIVEADRASGIPSMEIPGLLRNDDEFLSGLATDPEIAAEELRIRLKADDVFELTNGKMLRALGSAREITVRMTASGYFIPSGFLRPYNVIALREGEHPLRKRFTIAHELGHAAAYQFAGQILPTNEEDWCDSFATAVLMPRMLVERFSTEGTGLSHWLEFASVFNVSMAAAIRRAWWCKKKLIISSKLGVTERTPQRVQCLRMLEEGKALQAHSSKYGTLASGERYFVKRSGDLIEAVADFSE